ACSSGGLVASVEGCQESCESTTVPPTHWTGGGRRQMQTLDAGKVTLELVGVPPGHFVMGSGNEYFSETPAHPVRIRGGFLLGKSPIMQGQWLGLMGDNPSAFRAGPDLPVDTVNWDQARAFCGKLSEQSGRHVRLPSEAEWEYACRGGRSGEFF